MVAEIEAINDNNFIFVDDKTDAIINNWLLNANNNIVETAAECSTVLSTDDFNQNTFNIYPNPSRTSFSVNVNVSNVEVYDLTGKLVKSFKGSFTRTDSFDVSSLNSGMYMVKVQNDTNQIMTTKLVKL